MAELSQAAPPAVVHTRLERVEAGYDAAHFLSLIATAEFFTLVFAYLGVAALVMFRGGGVHDPQIIVAQIAAAIIALGVVWVMYRVRTPLVLR
jgi:glycine/D-amino acid oxidase-like deaminating enzyme